MITKIQKLSAIHNVSPISRFANLVVYDYKDTKIVSNSQQFHCHSLGVIGCLWLQRYKNCQQFTTCIRLYMSMLLLFMITKIQKLSAIHNVKVIHAHEFSVVYDYKDTKIVSNSQQVSMTSIFSNRCLWLQRYKNCQQFTTMGRDI